MAKTRGRQSKKGEKETIEAVPVISTPKVQLDAEVASPPQLFILPENLSPEARIVQLENPRHSTNSPYIICPEGGFYELTRVAAPKTTPRSWLLSSNLNDSTPSDEDIQAPRHSTAIDGELSRDGYVLRNANLLVSTPIDPLFLVLPALISKPASKTSNSSKKLFLTGEDYLDKAAAASPELKPFLRVKSVTALLEQRMAVVCDTVDAGDETMYRVSENKLVAELLRKARGMARQGLTLSMEERFVRKALEVPSIPINLQELKEEDDSGTSTPATETHDTQTTTLSADSAAGSFSETSTAATSFSDDSSINITQKPIEAPVEAPEGVADLLRLRTALFFICSKYLAPSLTETIKNLAASPTSDINFEPLNTHLADLATRRQEAFTARSLGDASRKRGFEEDDDEDGNGESRAEKKRRKEEEEKRKKAGESRGVKNLKKVNVSGMKKMSDFFKKK